MFLGVLRRRISLSTVFGASNVVHLMLGRHVAEHDKKHFNESSLNKSTQFCMVSSLTMISSES